MFAVRDRETTRVASLESIKKKEWTVSILIMYSSLTLCIVLLRPMRLTAS